MGIRPIVSSCESPTENIPQFLGFWLQPLIKALSPHLKNTTELINELKDLTVEPDTILVTIDVKSLYTCIPHQEGIEACREALQSTVTMRITLQDQISLCLYLRKPSLVEYFIFREIPFLNIQATLARQCPTVGMPNSQHR